MSLLMAYRWPGNVRELENTIERAAILAETGMLEPQHLPERIRRCMGVEAGLIDLKLKDSVKAFERQIIAEALRRTGGNRTQAAKLLGISIRTLLYKIKEHDIEA